MFAVSGPFSYALTIVVSGKSFPMGIRYHFLAQQLYGKLDTGRVVLDPSNLRTHFLCILRRK